MAHRIGIDTCISHSGIDHAGFDGRKPTMTRPTRCLKPDPRTNHNQEKLPVDLLLRRVIEEAKTFQAPKDADRSKK